jgi:AHBA synthesis associated protein
MAGRSGGATGTQRGCVLWDLDGVIIDSKPVLATVLAVLATECLGRTISAEDTIHLVGSSPPRALALLGVRDSFSVYNSRYDEVFRSVAHLVRQVQRAVEVFCELASRRVPVGIVTKQSRARLDGLVPASVSAAAGAIVAWEDVERRKPFPDGLLLAAEKLGSAPASSLYVGDEVADIQAAKAARMLAIAALWGNSDAHTLRQSRPDTMLAEDRLTADLIENLLFERRAKE